MAVCAGDSSLSVDSVLCQLVVRVLSLEDMRLAQRVDVVIVVLLVVVSLHILKGHPLVPGEGEVVTVLLEVVLDVTLSTDEGAHLLMRSLGDVDPAALHSLYECRAADVQLHRLSIVAVGAADGIDYLASPVGPAFLVKLLQPHLLHHSRHIRTLAGPACGRLEILPIRKSRGTRSQGISDILDSVHMSSRGGVVAAEGVSCPQDDHLRSLCQHIHRLAPIVSALEGRVCGLPPGVVLPGIIDAVDLALCLARLDVDLLIGVDRSDLCASLCH